jgi:hypothetical protein
MPFIAFFCSRQTRSDFFDGPSLAIQQCGGCLLRLLAVPTPPESGPTNVSLRMRIRRIHWQLKTGENRKNHAFHLCTHQKGGK